jgi:hypothetical protein
MRSIPAATRGPTTSSLTKSALLGAPQQERHERIDRKIDGRQFAGQIVAGRGLLPWGKLPPQIVQRLFPDSVRRETLSDFSEILIGLGRQPALDCALARVASEKSPPQQPTNVDLCDDRRGFGEREIVVDQDWPAATGLSAPNSGVSRSPASNDAVLQ